MSKNKVIKKFKFKNLTDIEIYELATDLWELQWDQDKERNEVVWKSDCPRKWFDTDNQWKCHIRLIAKLLSKGGMIGSNHDGYRRVSFRNDKIFAHQISWILTHKQRNTLSIDHISFEDRTNNDPSNLRETTPTGQAANRKSSHAVRDEKGHEVGPDGMENIDDRVVMVPLDEIEWWGVRKRISARGGANLELAQNMADIFKAKGEFFAPITLVVCVDTLGQPSSRYYIADGQTRYRAYMRATKRGEEELHVPARLVKVNNELEIDAICYKISATDAALEKTLWPTNDRKQACWEWIGDNMTTELKPKLPETMEEIRKMFQISEKLIRKFRDFVQVWVNDIDREELPKQWFQVLEKDDEKPMQNISQDEFLRNQMKVIQNVLEDLAKNEEFKDAIKDVVVLNTFIERLAGPANYKKARELHLMYPRGDVAILPNHHAMLADIAAKAKLEISQAADCDILDHFVGDETQVSACDDTGLSKFQILKRSRDDAQTTVSFMETLH